MKKITSNSQNKKSFLRGEAGFSLIEVMIAGGLLATTALAGAQVFQASLIAKRKLETNNGRRILGDDVRQSFRDIETCSANLSGMRADIATADLQLYRLQPSGAPGVFEKALTPFVAKTTSTAGSRTDSLEIKELSMHPLANLTNRTRMMEIVVTSVTSKVLGSRETTDRIPIQVTMDPTQKFVEECLGVEGDVDDLSTAKMACEMNQDGTARDFYFNETTRSCEYAKYSITRTGNENDAYCEAGETPLSCTLIGNPAGGLGPDLTIEPWKSIYNAHKTLHVIYANGVPEDAWYVDNIWTATLTSNGCHVVWNIPQLTDWRQAGVICTGKKVPTPSL